MIELTKLLDKNTDFPHSLRYSKKVKHQQKGAAGERGPVVAWNITRRCNLACEHCYSSSSSCDGSGELSTAQCKKLVDELAALKVPVILISGGEPLLRDDIFEIMSYIKNRGLKVTLSTNGTLIDDKTAGKIKKCGVSYIGISLDGRPGTHNEFRGNPDAFQKALRGLDNCRAQNQKVGIRFTLFKNNFQDLSYIFNIIEEKNIPRACFYHLVYTGRAEELIKLDLSLDQKRRFMDLLYDKSKQYLAEESGKEILTVAHQADGVYLYLKLKKEDSKQAPKALSLLQRNGGNRSGQAIVSIDDQGGVHPNQFMDEYSLGNVKNEKFSDIWQDKESGLLYRLRNRKRYLKGRCSRCIWLDICNGSSRMRAKKVYGDLWASDPACYLNSAEITLQKRSEK